MEEDLILHQPVDRRLENVNTLPLGPPGTEFDPVEPDPPKDTEKLNGSKNYDEKGSSSKQSRFSSPVLRSKRKSPSRGRRSPTPDRRRRRSSSPRRYGYSAYGSSERRRYDNNHRQHRQIDRRRSPPPRDWRDRRDRDRFYRSGRQRSDSRSRSRSSSPRPNIAKKNWSPGRNTNSPNLGNIQAVAPPSIVQPPQSQNQAYRMMPSQMYGETYGQGQYNQYDLQHTQPNFVQQNNPYPVPANIGPTFNPSYPPPSSWDGYTQQAWMPTALPNPTQVHQVHVPGSMSQVIAPPTTINVLSDAAPGTVEVNSTHDAVAQEAENQRDELKKQRTSYLKKTVVLKKELRILKEQRKELNSTSAPPSPTTQGFINENENLQSQIERKLSTIENVIDMLTGIIGEENLDKDLGDQIEADTSKELEEILVESVKDEKERAKKKSVSSESSSDTSSSSSSTSSGSSSEHDDSSPERLKNKVIESMKAKQREAVIKKLKDEKKVDQFDLEATECYNYVFYDPEMHWCQTCDIFPKTAKDYLNHLHTKEHMDRESIDTPWHLNMINDQYPTYDNAPTKRTPIRGLTFFVPATAWFCKLCSVWMGDLHCASTHLKSRTHSNKYLSFLEKNPHHEVNWLADRQRVLNEKRATPLPPQITSISTTATEVSNSKQETGITKSQKKKKRKTSDKKSKKKKREKRSKKGANVSSTSSSGTGSSSENDDKDEKKKKLVDSKEFTSTLPASSIRVAMRNQIQSKDEKPLNVSPPPPPKIATNPKLPVDDKSQLDSVKQKEGSRPADTKEKEKSDDVIIRQWNSVQPVISDSEKKLLEQLKDKLKGKSQEDSDNAVSSKNTGNSENVERDYRDRRRRSTSRRRGNSPRRRRSRSFSYGRNRGGRAVYRRGRRSRSRSKGWYGRRRGRSRSRSRTVSRSRSRSLRRRSRSYDRRRYTRSRSKSGSRNRIEKPIVKHPEFRPRVPEKEKVPKKSNDSKEKKELAKKQKSQTAAATGKKLPFIGKMPVFKKQTSGQTEGNERRNDELSNELSTQFMLPTPRPPAPTAAQINMAMMEDVYGNAPPFHPDAGMMVDYDDLMPDPVQFVNIMGQAPPPPPTQTVDKSSEDDTEDVLPPGIDEIESDEFVAKPLEDTETPDKNQLPKDLEEALNIIFPGEKKPEDAEDKAKMPAGETQIIVEKPIMQVEDLVKEGIHLVSIQQTTVACMQENTELSMNEPLNFNNQMGGLQTLTHQEIKTGNHYAVELDNLPLPSTDEGTSSECKKNELKNSENEADVVLVPAPNEIPMPAEETDAMESVIYDLDDIPEPSNSTKETERTRRQEELDDLAMLGIDADDMAAQCM